MANFITSAGDICESYECMDVITAFKSGEGNFDYPGALAFLVDQAKKNGADGVIHVNFKTKHPASKNASRLINPLCFTHARRHQKDPLGIGRQTARQHGRCRIQASGAGLLTPIQY